MRRTGLTGVGLLALAVAVAGCNPARIGERRNEKPFAVSAKLDCPAQQGSLRRESEAADGRSCGYTGDDGEKVELRTVALDGRDAQTALTGIEDELRSVVPYAPGGSARGSSADRDDNTDEAEGNVAQTTTETAEDGAARTTVSRRRDRSDDHAHIDLPGFHVDADGDKAQVNIGGMHINADGDRADVQVNRPGGHLASVHADDRGAEVHIGDIGPKNVDASFILASDRAGPDGAKTAGYVARGPIGGPLVVAVQTGRGHGEDHDSVNDGFHDARRLVARNVTRGR